MNRRRHTTLTDFMADPDVAAMLAFQRGDIQAFEELVARHTDVLVNFFYFQGRDSSLAEDCTQEVWLKIFRSCDDYQPRARFKTYLLRQLRIPAQRCRTR